MANLWSESLKNLISAGTAIVHNYDSLESKIKILENQTIYFKSDMSADADGSPRATQIDPDGQTETSLRRTNGWLGEGDNVNAENMLSRSRALNPESCLLSSLMVFSIL